MRPVIYWLRWLAVLPGAALAVLLANVLLHVTLYQALTGSGVEPYPELPERILIPFASAIGFIWGGSRIAPARKIETAIILFSLTMIILGGFVFLAVFGEKWMRRGLFLRGYGLSSALAFVGGIVALHIVRREQEGGTK